MKRKGIVNTLIFVVWIFGICIAYFAVPGRDFSEMENRYLARFPRFSLKDLADGDFTSGVENYLNDQIIGRDGFKELNTAATYFSGMRESNGVYYAEGGALIQEFLPDGDTLENAERNAEAVKAFAGSSSVPVYFALIPSAAEIYRDALPKGAPNADQKALISELYGISGGGIDIYSAVAQHSDDYIWYKTDHHWTSLGAYYAYAALAPAMGIEPVGLERYERSVLSRSFYGALYSKSPAYWIEPDEIGAYVPEDGIKVRSFENGEATEKELYCGEFLDKKDKYSVFLGGNQPLITVETENGDGRKLLVLRDSYMDSCVPFLTAHFSGIDLIDPRYYKLGISDYIEENGVDAVLICYSVYNFSSDTYLRYVLK